MNTSKTENPAEILYNAAILYDQLGDVQVYQLDDIETIISLGNSDNWEGIITLFCDHDDISGNELIHKVFDITIEELNTLATEHGFCKI